MVELGVQTHDGPKSYKDGVLGKKEIGVLGRGFEESPWETQMNRSESVRTGVGCQARDKKHRAVRAIGA